MAAPAQVSDEDLCEEFSMFGVELEDENILDKVKELCILLSKDAAEIVDEWVAFASSNSVKTSDVNLENLSRFERAMEKKPSNKSTPKTPSALKTPKFRNSKPVGESDDILNSYCSPAGKGSKRQHTPDHSSAKRVNNVSRSPATSIPQSPAPFSPADAKSSESYTSRTGKGNTIASLNVKSTVSWTGGKCGEVTAEVHPDCLTKHYKHMFQKNQDKIDVLDDMIEDFGDLFKEGKIVEEFAHATLPAQEQVTIVGRIGCDSNGKLNAQSVIFEGSRENCGGRTVSVDLSHMKQYSLFSGQIVAMEGVNTTGSKFVVKNFVDMPIPAPLNKDAVVGPFTVMVACGPFTTSDSVAYEPLQDLLEVIRTQQPDVCILMGPFVDEKNDALGTITDVTFEELFQKQIHSVLESAESQTTKFVFLPSNRDVHHSFVYPQPPYSCSGVEDSDNIIFASDPCILRINNVTFGLTSTDSLFHLGQQELASGLADKIPRLVRHLLQQRKFYPLYPPGEDVNLDFENWITYAKMPETPNILIIPSKLQQFVKEVSGCCCVNPGSLARGKSGGAYAQFVINPTDAGVDRLPNIAVKVVKI